MPQLSLLTTAGEASEQAPGWAGAYLEHLTQAPDYAGELVHVADLDPRLPTFGELPRPLPVPLDEALRAQGITRLYRHQVEAIEHVRAGRDVVVVSGTASGKSLCYNLPILEQLLDDPTACALYLFPTKALAQDQLLALRRLGELTPDVGRLMRAGTYDGDTSSHARRKLRDQGNLILTNPDMLHQGILPYHTRWSRFLSSLRVIVIDELHTYRGIFGSHVANVMRRLDRLCATHDVRPTFVMSSATIRNPGEMAARLTGRPVETVTRDDSPRGRRLFAFWNPSVIRQAAPRVGRNPPEGAGNLAEGPGNLADGSGNAPEGVGSAPEIDLTGRQRRPAAADATRHFVDLVARGVQTIVFTKSRVTAELVLRYAREELAARRTGLAARISAYRAGYLPEERRTIERRLHSGELLGVVSTTALELGIDIGRLDAAILLGFPPTIASAWQQAGRAGRQGRDALVVAIAYEDPIDQYLMRHPRYFFGCTPERAVIDPDNPYVVAGHLGCAAHETPLTPLDVARFGELAEGVRDIMIEEGRLHPAAGRIYWSAADMPARSVNLRTISDDTYTILDAGELGRVVGTVDGISALELIFPEAIYLHEGETYYVRELDLEQKVAFVEQRDVDYFTQPVLDNWIRIEYEEESRRLGRPGGAGELTAPGPERDAGGVVFPSDGVILDAPRAGRTLRSERPVIVADGTREPAAATPGGATPVTDCQEPRLALGAAEVSWQTTAMRKIQFRSRDSIGHHALDLPRLTLPTRSVWLWVGEEIWGALGQQGRSPMEPLSGLRNLLITLVPMHVMCDPSDLGGVIDTRNAGRPCIYLFDRYPGGLGFCDRAFMIFEELLIACLELVRDCPCGEGCPSCVGLPVLRPAQQQDPDMGHGWPIPDKRATIQLVKLLLAAERTGPEVESS